MLYPYLHPLPEWTPFKPAFLYCLFSINHDIKLLFMHDFVYLKHLFTAAFRHLSLLFFSPSFFIYLNIKPLSPSLKVWVSIDRYSLPTLNVNIKSIHSLVNSAQFLSLTWILLQQLEYWCLYNDSTVIRWTILFNRISRNFLMRIAWAFPWTWCAATCSSSSRASPTSTLTASFIVTSSHRTYSLMPKVQWLLSFVGWRAAGKIWKPWRWM